MRVTRRLKVAACCLSSRLLVVVRVPLHKVIKGYSVILQNDKRSDKVTYASDAESEAGEEDKDCMSYRSLWVAKSDFVPFHPQSSHCSLQL